MSTNSRIGIRLPDDSILSVYHHWDGYPEWLGVTLKQQYNTREKIEELIDGGNMSSCYTDSGWDLDEKREYAPLYYTERGESLDDNAPKLSKNEKEYLVTTDKCCGEFAYIFELNNTWRCIELRFWDSATGQFYDKFDSQERNIPDNYPQELAA